MLCFLTVRKLKPGSYDAFRQAWEPEEGDIPEGFQRAYHLRSLEDENEVISFGFFDGSPEDLERLRGDESFRSRREAQVERINEHVESVGTDAVFEVVEEVKLGG
jgi:heme-degrading monooxygenase HmoA